MSNRALTTADHTMPTPLVKDDEEVNLGCQNDGTVGKKLLSQLSEWDPSCRPLRPPRKARLSETAVTNLQIDYNNKFPSPPGSESPSQVPNSTMPTTDGRALHGMPGQPGSFWVYRAFSQRYQRQDNSFYRWSKHLGDFFQSSGGLFLALVFYTLAGASVFMVIERTREIEIFMNLSKSEEDMLQHLWNASREQNISEAQWVAKAMGLMHDFKLRLETASAAGINAHTNLTNVKWDFLGSVLFCITTYTTIGYGHVAPSTGAGRITLVVYAIFGIPLCLMGLARVGVFLNRFLKTCIVYMEIRLETTGVCLHYTRLRQQIHDQLRGLSVRIHDQRFVNKVVQTHFRTEEHPDLYGIPDEQPKSKKKSISHSPDSAHRFLPEGAVLEALRHSKQVTFKEVYNAANDNFDIPLSLAILFVVFYLLIGALFFSIWENWSYLNSVYFIFVSITTIGFGDLVPTQRAAFICFSFYVIFGLSLLSMVVNILMNSMARKLAKAQDKIAKKLSSFDFDNSFAWKFPGKRKLSI